MKRTPRRAAGSRGPLELSPWSTVANSDGQTDDDDIIFDSRVPGGHHSELFPLAEKKNVRARPESPGEKKIRALAEEGTAWAEQLIASIGIDAARKQLYGGGAQDLTAAAPAHSIVPPPRSGWSATGSTISTDSFATAVDNDEFFEVSAMPAGGWRWRAAMSTTSVDVDDVQGAEVELEAEAVAAAARRAGAAAGAGAVAAVWSSVADEAAGEAAASPTASKRAMTSAALRRRLAEQRRVRQQPRQNPNEPRPHSDSLGRAFLAVLIGRDVGGQANVSAEQQLRQFMLLRIDTENNRNGAALGSDHVVASEDPGGQQAGPSTRECGARRRRTRPAADVAADRYAELQQPQSVPPPHTSSTCAGRSLLLMCPSAGARFDSLAARG